MSRQCQCRRGCKHLVPSASDALLAPSRLLALDALEGLDRTLIDAADAFDSDGLIFDDDCEVHGSRPTSDAPCSCRGERVSAVEFVQALLLDVRSAGGGRRADHRENSRSGQQQRYSGDLAAVSG